MALANAAAPDRNPTPTDNANPARLTLNLSSNNPFRNRTSPQPSPRSSEALSPASAKMSTNPFLDSSELSSPQRRRPNNNDDVVNGLTADIFGNMSLQDKPKPAQNASQFPRPPRAGTMPVNGPPQRGPPSPAKRDQRPSRPRRASESSTMENDRRVRHDRDRSERPPRTESEERRRRERRKEREERHKREKERGKSGKSNKPQRGLDIIDKLDVTGIYGQGLFHHDGPFDACNPHRNVKKDRRAPMNAFPADSMNMAIGGRGPLNNALDYDRIHGRGEEGFQDFATARRGDLSIVNPTDRVEQVHGAETYGLGTSTFLDGAPAPKSAIQRRESEDNNFGVDVGSGGLQRKKSLAQRLRGMSASRRYGPGTDGAMRSPEARYNSSSPTDANGNSPPRIKAQSAGGRARATAGHFDGSPANEINPFDSEYNAAFDKKGAQIRIAEENGAQASGTRHVQRPSSPVKNGTVRTVRTDDAQQRSSNEEDKPPSTTAPTGGFLNRMKSLKGGPRRPRPERGGSNY